MKIRSVGQIKLSIKAFGLPCSELVGRKYIPLKRKVVLSAEGYLSSRRGIYHLWMEGEGGGARNIHQNI